MSDVFFYPEIPRTTVGACPWCLTKILLVDGIPLQHDEVSMGYCHLCGNIVAAWVDSETGNLTASTFGYKWFHNNISEGDRIKLREYQERHHHSKGHWG